MVGFFNVPEAIKFPVFTECNIFAAVEFQN